MIYVWGGADVCTGYFKINIYNISNDNFRYRTRREKCFNIIVYIDVFFFKIYLSFICDLFSVVYRSGAQNIIYCNSKLEQAFWIFLWLFFSESSC